jgi:hypothetical protein
MSLDNAGVSPAILVQAKTPTRSCAPLVYSRYRELAVAALARRGSTAGTGSIAEFSSVR